MNILISKMLFVSSKIKKEKKNTEDSLNVNIKRIVK